MGSQGPGRVRSFDWLRGLAVLVMVQTHALALLAKELRQGPFFQKLQWVDGLVAPSFILAAGFSLALVQVRGAAAGARRKRARKSLRRILEVVFVAAFMTWIFFPIFQEPKWLLRIDILSCIGLSLLLALPLFAGLAHRPKLLAGVNLAIAVGILFATPPAEALTGPLAHFLTNKPLQGPNTGSVFPLFPWTAHVFLGGSLGAMAAHLSTRRFALYTAALIGIGYGVWLVGAKVMAADPSRPWWMTPNHAERWMVVCALALALLGIEHLLAGAWQKSFPVRFVEVFGTSSLAAYFTHESLLYTHLFGISFNALWGEKAPWAMYWGLVALLIAMTFGLTWLIAKIYDWQEARRSGWIAKVLGRTPPAAPTGVVGG